MIEAIVDNETWGLRVTSIVRSVGIVVFEGRNVLEKHYFRINEDEQRVAFEYAPVAPEPFMQFLPRTVDRSTVEWWAKPENAAAQDTIMDAPLFSWVGGRTICGSVGDRVQAIWAKPGMFDLPMLRDLFGQDIWPYWKERDLSTLLGEFDPARTTRPKFDGTPHNALDDAVHAHTWLCDLRERLGKPSIYPFELAWGEYAAAGYKYGSDALDHVRLGWEIARGEKP